MTENLNFLKVAIKDIKTTGSITGSSNALVRKMMEPIDFGSANMLVEFGAGDGCITKALLQQMPCHARLISFELNYSFYHKLLAIQDPKVQFLNASVLDLMHYTAPNTADTIVSGLPLANFKNAEKKKLLELTHNALNDNGLFIQFQYTLTDFKLLKQFFNVVKLDFTMRNIPPAFIYICHK